MAGVGVISSVAVFVFVLLASFSAAREERSPRRESTDWAAVTEADQTKYNYLVLLKNAELVCSGSIPSKWTVLTFCATVTNTSNTKAYAGMITVATAAAGQPGVQERNVKKVVADKTLKELKICILTEIWELKGTVGSIPVSGSGDTCTVLGFGKVSGNDVARVMTAQIAASGASCKPTEGDQFGSEAAANRKLDGLDFGGPVVCGGKQRGINKEHKAGPPMCNVYIELAPHSDWINDQIAAADPEAPAGNGGTGGTGGTGGNGTASSGYSIHSHLNKYSNWKVLWFLVPTIVTFLQY